MDRKDFLKSAVITAGSIAILGSPCTCLARGAMGGLPTTSSEKKAEFAELWMKRFFEALDNNVDEATRLKLMHTNGSMCYRGSLNGKMPEQVSVDDFVTMMQSYVGAENCRREGNIVYFNYVGNPDGLKISDGYCLCPIVESGPPGLSGTYCECSVGYVTDMFELHTGSKARVELLESLKRGGKGCKFKITLA